MNLAEAVTGRELERADENEAGTASHTGYRRGVPRAGGGSWSPLAVEASDTLSLIALKLYGLAVSRDQVHPLVSGRPPVVGTPPPLAPITAVTSPAVSSEQAFTVLVGTPEVAVVAGWVDAWPAEMWCDDEHPTATTAAAIVTTAGRARCLWPRATP